MRFEDRNWMQVEDYLKGDDHINHDTSTGDLTHFTGREWIEKSGEKVYELVYHGGLIH